jgi:(1->4)-alpha-D-glucan 1-alpha-D-glucosylmutase
VHDGQTFGQPDPRSEGFLRGTVEVRATNGGNVAARRVTGAPGSTYRLQLTPEFGFAQAAETADYLADLGVTHAYLSPVLDAVPGSMHGYDVTDHARIRGELGGEEGFRALAKRLHSRGLGIVLDIVPNHMAVPTDMCQNRQLWSVLRDGRGSPYATWFDIDWAAQDDRMLLPVLGGPPESCLDDLWVEPSGGPEGEPVLRYFDHVLPLWPGTARLPMRGLLESQHYRLAWWQEAATELNWRRFFDIATLIGIRVEDPAVFDATHEVIVGLVAEGLVDGLRVDHPDGLADPRAYLDRLAAATGGAWVVVEKILAADETLPSDWACAGTTGYDALRVVDGLFLDPAGGDALSAEYARFCRGAGGEWPSPRFAEVATQAKREIANGSLSAEVTRLARLLTAVAPDAPAEDTRPVLTEVLAAFPVYRAYVHLGELPAESAKAAVKEAVDGARRRLPKRLRGLAADLGAAALGKHRPVGGAAGRVGEFAVRFQQTTGPVQAKGVEDTACYRWSRLISLNEVGCDPDWFGVTPAEFHAAAGRLAADWPAAMTTLSTHDTKRQEDVRARLAVLGEIPQEWGEQVARWHRKGTAVDADTEYLLWQTVVGAWPISGERLAGYLTKAIREAKRRTSWTDPDENYEAAVLALAASALDDPELSASIARFVAGIAGDAAVNSLGAKLVQLTMPGVPDVYQGCEAAALSLVDPDNRRDVGFPRIRSYLTDLDTGVDESLRADLADGDLDLLSRVKLLVTSRALRLRRARPRWFAGEYEPLAASGPAAGHAVAFRRGGQAVTVVTRLPVGLRRRGGWQDTALPLPGGPWADLLTGAVHHGPAVPMTELTGRLPVALLVPEGE